jgi:hypothetical protein
MRDGKLGRVALALFVGLVGACGGAPADDTTGSSAQLSAKPSATATTAATASAVTLTFASSATWTYGASSPLVAGDTVTVSWDSSRTSCVTTGMGTGPAWGTTGYAILPDGSQVSFPAGGLDLQNGGTPGFTIPAGSGGDLAVWFESTNIYGCHEYDSDEGQNFHFLVAASANAPSWVGDADAVVSRATCGSGACDSDRHDLSGGFTFDTWARQRAAVAEVEFQAYEAGVTDHPNADLWKQLDTEVHYRFGGSGAYTTAYVLLEDQPGNNARYAWNLGPIDPLPGQDGGTVTERTSCPTFATSLSADGQYIQTTADFWFTVNGVELRPAPGKTFSGTFSNYAGLYSLCNTAP